MNHALEGLGIYSVSQMYYQDLPLVTSSRLVYVTFSRPFCDPISGISKGHWEGPGKEETLFVCFGGEVLGGNTGFFRALGSRKLSLDSHQKISY